MITFAPRPTMLQKPMSHQQGIVLDHHSLDLQYITRSLQ